MREIKVNFVDFWSNLDKTDNYFYNLLIQKYKVVIDDDPDILFYSCYGREYLKYKCKRIFFSGENVRPDFMACDFAFSFDFNKRKNHFRLPLYSLYIDHHRKLDHVMTLKTREEAKAIWHSKSKFCCMVVSNGDSPERLDFFKNLSKIKRVDSGGGILNNVGGKVADKLEFIKEYKFVISFENKKQTGYTTEKILEPIFTDSIPIYWGNELVNEDFNSGRFINHNDFDSQEALINRILEIDNNDELAIKMLMEPTFSTNKLPHEEEHRRVLEILCRIVEGDKKPVAKQFWIHIHRIKLKLYSVKQNFKRYLKTFFKPKK